MKNVLFVLSGLCIVAALVFVITPVVIRNNVADAEVLVVRAKDQCAVTYDNGIKAVIEMAQVDKNTKEYIAGVFESLSPQESADVKEAYGQFINGNPQSFMLLMSTISGTNITATAENVQREVSAQRSAMLTCASSLVGSQANLKSIAGMDASGTIVKFPQKYMNLRNVPSDVVDPYLFDNDGDGRLTVLDYRPPVNVEISQSFGSGEGLPVTDIYKTP